MPDSDWVVTGRTTYRIHFGDLCIECKWRQAAIREKWIYGDAFPCNECKARIIARADIAEDAHGT